MVKKNEDLSFMVVGDDKPQPMSELRRRLARALGRKDVDGLEDQSVRQRYNALPADIRERLRKGEDVSKPPPGSPAPGIPGSEPEAKKDEPKTATPAAGSKPSTGAKPAGGTD